MIKVGSDFSGVGAFNQALIRLGVDFEEVFACDMDKYSRQTFELNYGLPKYFPKNVYEREIPSESLDIYMTSPPCQSFSLAGKRKGEDSKNGVLFYNSHEFIQKNKPRFFIFENVKGLLSDDEGRTFQRWIDYLGGKSQNGNMVIFPHENSVPYHVYYQVLNAKHYGIPQNRERIFIIGIRDDADNTFSFPKPFHLEKRLKDVLESEVDEKYFLSDKMLDGLIKSGDKSYINQDTQASKVFSENGESPNICAGTHGYANGYVSTFNNKRLNETLKNVKLPNEIAIIDSYNQIINTEYSHTVSTRINASSCSHVIIPANNSKGYDIAEEEEDSINFSNPNSETRRGRVGHGVAQTLDTACNQGVLTKQLNKNQQDKFDNLKVDENIAGCLTEAIGRAGSSDEYMSMVKRNAIITRSIRRLTPLECFRLMDFNENFKWDVSDSQAYKQAGNSICVGVLAKIIERLKL